MKIKTDLKSILEEHKKCVNYNVIQDYYRRTNLNEKFYIGRQWYGVNAPDLDKPVLNFIRRSCSFLVAMTTGDGITAFITPYTHGAERVKTADYINTQIEKICESSKLMIHAKKAVTDGVVKGDGYLYWLYRDGGIYCENLKPENVMPANPYLDNMQKQPYILIEKRDYVEKVIETAKKNKGEPEKIKADENYMNAVEALPMVTVITKMYIENGTVHYTRVTKDGVVTPPTATGYTVYPIAKFSWDKQSNSYHGVGAVESLIPNQIAVNKLWAMALLHQKSMAFPKIFFDKTKFDGWTNKVGAAIGVVGNPKDAVAMSFKADDMSDSLMELVEKTISYTKEFMGASDNSLGNVSPDNTSAILAVQRAATIPLANQRQYFYRFMEDCVLIMLDIARAKFGERYVEMTDENGEYYMGKFDFSQIDTTQLSWSVETDNSTPWSEGIQMQTLEKLYARQILTDAYDYVRAIPQSRLKNKARILKKLRIKTEQN